ncbi:MAG: hypothetical protein IKK24_05135 [Clostridia bacterium]|nr:hypothetical protein [Clostridia bacterium]
MKTIEKKNIVKIIIPLILAISISINTAGASYYGNNGDLMFKVDQSESVEVEEETGDDWEDWEDWEDVDLSVGANEVEISKTFTPKLISENKNFKLWYDTTGADIYVMDKRSGHIWSNTVNEDYYNNEEASVAMRSLLLQVTITDKEGDIVVNQLCDAVADESKFSLSAEFGSDSMTLDVELIKFSVSFSIDFSLDEQGLLLSIPSDSIKQAGGNKIVSIAVMPYFGAARTDQKGYILIPDGSGALVEFNNNEPKEERFYSYSLYGQSEQNMFTLRGRDDQDIKNIMLPVFGIKNQKNGFLAAITEGSESAYLNVVPYGYQCPKLGRAYYTFMYSYTEQISINGKIMDQIMPNQELYNRTIKYFLLDESCDYSEMASVYRKHLEEKGVLKNKIAKGGISLDIVMGVKKKGMFFESLVAMTDFENVREIAQDLKKSGIENLEISLLGWNNGGFTVLPTSQKVAGKLGGKKELKNLFDWFKKNEINAYLYNDFFEAKTDSKTVNIRKDIVRDYVGNMVKWSDRTMINTYASFNKYINSARSTGIYDNAGFSLARAGQWLWNSYENGNSNTRAETVKACVKAFKSCAKNENGLQVYGGNEYVLPYADSLREIPNEASNYHYETASVPFYQLVVNGYVNYTSVAGNMSYDTDYQKLKWIEYGSIPYYIITKENSVKLINTDYDKLFSSEYSMWKEQIKAVSGEFSSRLAVIKDAEMVEHHKISNKISSVKYSNGIVIYINYGSDAAKINEVTVEGMNYSVVDSEGKVIQ